MLLFCGFVALSGQRWQHLTILSVSQRSKSWRISFVFWHVRKKKKVLVDLSVFSCMFHNVSNCTNQLTTKCHRHPTAAATEACSTSSIWQHTCPHVFASSLFFQSQNGDCPTIESTWNKTVRPCPILLVCVPKSIRGETRRNTARARQTNNILCKRSMNPPACLAPRFGSCKQAHEHLCLVGTNVCRWA